MIDAEGQSTCNGKGFNTLVRDGDDWRYPATGRRTALMQDLYIDGFAVFR